MHDYIKTQICQYFESQSQCNSCAGDCSSWPHSRLVQQCKQLWKYSLDVISPDFSSNWHEISFNHGQQMFSHSLHNIIISPRCTRFTVRCTHRGKYPSQVNRPNVAARPSQELHCKASAAAANHFVFKLELIITLYMLLQFLGSFSFTQYYTFSKPTESNSPAKSCTEMPVGDRSLPPHLLQKSWDSNRRWL